jgi:Right handed beta helix region
MAFGPMRGAEFWVAPGGRDSGDGSKSAPFGGLEAARDAVRAARKMAPDGAMTVHVLGGDHFRTAALELTEADGGAVSRPVRWVSEPGERPRLLGGVRLKAFAKVNDPGVIARLPASARGHVLVCDLQAMGITRFGGLRSRGFGRPTTPAHAELFFGGRPMTLARWPNVGEFATITGYPDVGASKDEHGGNLGKLENGFIFSGDQPAVWKNAGDIWVHGYWAWDWANSYEKVSLLDPAKHLVVTAPPHGLYGFRKGQRFYFLNVLEELDQPGEWYLDATAGRLYFWPPAPLEGPEAGETLLSMVDQPLVRFRGVSNIVFRGFTIEAGRASGVEVEGGSGVRIEGCLLRNLGNNGVVIRGGRGNVVDSCDVYDTGDGGVLLSGGDRKTLESGGHAAENCRLARQGRWSKCYVPAILLEGVGMRASHNLIEDHPHCGILFWGNDHLIEKNEIRRVALETGDVGAIYTGRDYSFRGNKIIGNYLHDIGGVGMGSMGVYADDCVSGLTVTDNIFLRVHRAAFLGGGRDHKVTDNIFVDCDPAVDVDGRGLDASPVWRSMVDETMRKSLAAMPSELYRARYPEIATLDAYYGAPGGSAIVGTDFKGVPPEGNLIARNVCVGKWLNVGWHAKASMLRVEDNLTNASSAFVKPPGASPVPCDFELRPGVRTGRTVQCTDIGLQQNVLRAGLPAGSNR